MGADVVPWLHGCSAVGACVHTCCAQLPLSKWACECCENPFSWCDTCMA